MKTLRTALVVLGFLSVSQSAVAKNFHLGINGGANFTNVSVAGGFFESSARSISWMGGIEMSFFQPKMLGFHIPVEVMGMQSPTGWGDASAILVLPSFMVSYKLVKKDMVGVIGVGAGYGFNLAKSGTMSLAGTSTLTTVNTVYIGLQLKLLLAVNKSHYFAVGLRNYISFPGTTTHAWNPLTFFIGYEF